MYTYANRKGKTYYVHAYETKKGRTAYTLKRSAEGALDALPEGYEVFENVNGRCFLRRERPTVITNREKAEVEAALRAHELKDYRVEVKDECITVCEPSMNADAIAEMMNPLSGLIGELLEPKLREMFGDETVEEKVRERKRQAADAARDVMDFFPVLRFQLVEEGGRQFAVERMKTFGDGEMWWPLDMLPLADALEKYVPHLGKDSFYELI